MKEADKVALHAACDRFVERLRKAGVRCRGDLRDNVSPGWKFNHWELKGVPIRLEVGPKDVKADGFVSVRRDTGDKVKMQRSKAVEQVSALLDDIQKSMFAKAKKDLDENLSVVDTWDEFLAALDNKHIIMAP